ncbi:MAG: bifunctional 5,10-methylene-tetrahydrofolate dehydrogenase/5,10-methylene-tetrahydrofolate cyclohydrolase [Actinomycetota bacterium]|nr:bifunctional 5,10-methylene-tetrahydrofolate dehydrogenase/5,10-methylene-tetrahydrofolate cyclohydrolase [Actinomycetota bacterium]
MNVKQANLIDGRAIAAELKQTLRDDIAGLRGEGVCPGLATVLFEDDYPAEAYQRRLSALASDLGCHFFSETLPRDAQEADALATVGKLGADPRINGILILRPLPPQISEAVIYEALDPLKDIEAVHPFNAGLLELGRPRFVPSTPASCFCCLDNYVRSSGRDPAHFYEGLNVVVVGRSANVGRPAVLLALARNATVMSCDEYTSARGKLHEYTERADVLIVAAGVPGLITGEHVSDGVIAIDVGINPVKEGTHTRLVGDFEFDSVAPKAEAITPVPGGVGPITQVWLLKNTVFAAQLQTGKGEIAHPADVLGLGDEG